eukprot:779955-Pleurochrysis_carterae.AAC.2
MSVRGRSFLLQCRCCGARTFQTCSRGTRIWHRSSATCGSLRAAIPGRHARSGSRCPTARPSRWYGVSLAASEIRLRAELVRAASTSPEMLFARLSFKS